jgi:hypothetical protein
MQIGTFNVTSAFTITRAMGILRCSVAAKDGTVSVYGPLSLPGLTPAAIELAEDTGITIGVDGQALSAGPIEDFTITPGTGYAELVVSKI